MSTSWQKKPYRSQHLFSYTNREICNAHPVTKARDSVQHHIAANSIAMSQSSTAGALLCMGNPLLDISAEVSLDLLTQYVCTDQFFAQFCHAVSLIA